MRSRYYVGYSRGKGVVFCSSERPTPESYPEYAAVVGPFRTKRGAEYMAAGGPNNPHLLSVRDAEYFAKLAADGKKGIRPVPDSRYKVFFTNLELRAISYCLTKLDGLLGGGDPETLDEDKSTLARAHAAVDRAIYQQENKK